MTAETAIKELITKVEEVRSLQKEFFRNRTDMFILQKAKAAEKELDNMIINYKQLFKN